MSRRHHGGRPHRSNGPGRPIDTSRPLGPVAPVDRSLAPVDRPLAPSAAADLRPEPRRPIASTAGPDRPLAALPVPPHLEPDIAEVAAPATVEMAPDRAAGEPLSRSVDRDAGGPLVRDPVNGPAFSPGHGPTNGSRLASGPGLGVAGACTAPQLRRFIKSRPYVPMHELRRRFGIDGGEDDVTIVDLANGRIYVGLPPREGSLLGELLRGGEVGYELSLDPRSPVVVGLYPMRPVART
jgi:hypothetical protein